MEQEESDVLKNEKHTKGKAVLFKGSHDSRNGTLPTRGRDGNISKTRGKDPKMKMEAQNC